MPFFGQEIFELAQQMDTSSPNAPQPAFGGMTYNQGLDIDQNAGVNGVDLAAPTDGPAWTTDLINSDHFIFASSGLAAAPGYPIVQVPAGMVLGVPVGISFIGTAFSEPTLIRLASGFDAATHARVVPTFAPTLPDTHLNGVPLVPPRRDEHRDNGKRPHRM